MISVTVAGVNYSLDDGTYCRFIGADGLGNPPSRRFSYRGSNQHGVTDYDFRLDPRIFTIVLEIEGTSLNDLYDKRTQLINILGPTPTNIPLVFKFQTNTTKYIEAYSWDEGQMGYQDKEGFTQRVVWVFEAPNPVFYDNNPGAITLGLGGGAGTFEVPTPVPTGVGASVADLTIPITYAGSWRTQPFMRLTGPITNPVITNLETDEILDFTGTTIAAGDYYEINPRFGKQTVKDSYGNNKIDDLSEDSDLSTFHLGPNPEVGGGYNVIQLTGTAINGNSYFEMYWVNYYKGI